MLSGLSRDTCPTPPPIPDHRQRPYPGRLVVLHLHGEAQQGETPLQLLTVDVGAGAGREPGLGAEVHVVDDEAVATGVRVQDVCLPKHGDQRQPGSRRTPRERRRAPGGHPRGRQSGEMGQSAGPAPSIPGPKQTDCEPDRREHAQQDVQTGSSGERTRSHSSIWLRSSTPRAIRPKRTRQIVPSREHLTTMGGVGVHRPTCPQVHPQSVDTTSEPAGSPSPLESSLIAACSFCHST